MSTRSIAVGSIHSDRRTMKDKLHDVYALDPVDRLGPSRHVGTYRGYAASLASRDEDVIAQLAAGGGWYRVFDTSSSGQTWKVHAPAFSTRQPSESIPPATSSPMPTT